MSPLCVAVSEAWVFTICPCAQLVAQIRVLGHHVPCVGAHRSARGLGVLIVPLGFQHKVFHLQSSHVFRPLVCAQSRVEVTAPIRPFDLRPCCTSIVRLAAHEAWGSLAAYSKVVVRCSAVHIGNGSNRSVEFKKEAFSAMFRHLLSLLCVGRKIVFNVYLR